MISARCAGARRPGGFGYLFDFASWFWKCRPARFASSVFLMLFLMMLLAVSSIVSPLLSRVLVDSGLSEGSMRAILGAGVGLCLVGLSQQLLSHFSKVLEITTAQSVSATVRSALSEAVPGLPQDRVAGYKEGYIVARVQRDAQASAGVLSSSATCATQALIWGFGVAAVMTFSRDVFIALAAMSVVAFALSLHWSRVLYSRSRDSLETAAKAFGSVGELVAGRESIACQGGRTFLTSRALNAQETQVRNYRKMLLTGNLLGSVMGGMKVLGLSAVIILAGSEVIAGQLTVGSWYAVSLYAGIVLSSSVTLARTLGGLGSSIAAVERVLEIASTQDECQPDEDSRGHGTEIDDVPAVELKDLSFGYAGRPTLFNAVDIEIPAHSVVLITGPSGSGKTTLGRLIVGIIQPCGGSVHILGRPPMPIGLHGSEGTTAMLPQDVFVAEATVSENIILGREIEEPEQTARNAAEKAGLHSEIEQMSEGYQTMLGPKGHNLSVGQRRRLAFARALVDRPEVLVLDEPFASLDSSAVQRLAETISEMSHETSVIVISHRIPEGFNPSAGFEVGDGHVRRLEHTRRYAGALGADGGV